MTWSDEQRFLCVKLVEPLSIHLWRRVGCNEDCTPLYFVWTLKDSRKFLRVYPYWIPYKVKKIFLKPVEVKILHNYNSVMTYLYPWILKSLLSYWLTHGWWHSYLDCVKLLTIGPWKTNFSLTKYSRVIN